MLRTICAPSHWSPMSCLRNLIEFNQSNLTHHVNQLVLDTNATYNPNKTFWSTEFLLPKIQRSHFAWREVRHIYVIKRSRRPSWQQLRVRVLSIHRCVTFKTFLAAFFSWTASKSKSLGWDDMGWLGMTAPKIAFNDPPLSLLVRNPKMDIERRRKTYYHMLPQAKPAMGTAMNAIMETANLRKSPSKPKPTSTQRSPPQCQLVAYDHRMLSPACHPSPTHPKPVSALILIRSRWLMYQVAQFIAQLQEFWFHSQQWNVQPGTSNFFQAWRLWAVDWKWSWQVYTISLFASTQGYQSWKPVESNSIVTKTSIT